MGETLSFVVNDRRGQKKEREPEPVAQVESPAAKVEGMTWQEVTYVTMPAPIQGGVLFVLKAVARRSDGKIFSADAVVAPYYREGLEGEWAKTCRKRLDTFLSCGCQAGHVCATHTMYHEQWKRADEELLTHFGTAAVPESLEAFMRAAQASARAKIIAPGRG